MNKGELRTNFDRYKRLIAHRMRNEGAIIEALPHRLNVTRIAAPKTLNTPENGTVEIEALDYGDALTLGDRFAELRPTPLVRVVAERTPGHKTTTFMPAARVSRRWYEDKRVRVEEVYPILFQLAPLGSELSPWPRVYLEWFAELRHELIVNIRVTINEHPVAWRDRGFVPDRWTWDGAPESDGQRVLAMSGLERPPLVTLWWKVDCGHFPFALLGDGREVARVK